MLGSICSMLKVTAGRADLEPDNVLDAETGYTGPTFLEKHIGKNKKQRK